MYFAIAHFQFVDNAIIPVAPGGGCSDPSGLCLDGKHQEYQGRTTIADLLLKAGKTFAVYADGWNEAVAAGSSCPSPSAQCPNSSCILHPVACNGCRIETADIPFAYYEQLLPYFKDYDEFSKDLDGGKLPSFSFIKPRSWRNEHPNLANITDGVTFVGSVLDHVAKSSFAGNTLLLVTWDEGGGFFDHVAPPAPIDKDDQNAPVPYGTRVPLLAIGPFARKGTVSHVTLEHSSIVRFLEYNFIGPTGQLGFNDAKVHNLGSLLDPAATVVTVPED